MSITLASVLTPTDHRNLSLAAQVGVEAVVLRYPKGGFMELAQQKNFVESYGLKVAAIEGYLPIENIKLGNDQAPAEIEEMKCFISLLGKSGIDRVCYNFMPGGDWARTQFWAKERGGALVSAFNVDDVRAAIDQPLKFQHEDLWSHLFSFLEQAIPVAEENNVTLAMHPDDPPIDNLYGYPRIFNCVSSFDHLFETFPSPKNALCFCQGTFAEMGVDIPETIRHFGDKIQYVHFRDVAGERENFRETFHDNGSTDMFAAMRAYHEIDFDGPLRPDHVPQLYGEEEGDPGYTTLGRLHAIGYIQGLNQAAKSLNTK